MDGFRPSRRVSFFGILAIVAGVIAASYRNFAGDNVLALVLGLIAIGLGLITLSLFYIEQGRYQKKSKTSEPCKTGARRGRVIAFIGAAFVLGSFVWLGAVIALLGASADHMLLFKIWVVVFLIGCFFLFFSTVMKWAALLGLTRSNRENRD